MEYLIALILIAIVLGMAGSWSTDEVIDKVVQVPVKKEEGVEVPVVEPELRYLTHVPDSEYGSVEWVHMYPGTKLLQKPCLEWFIDEWVKTHQISPAEQLIITELNKYQIHWEREVSFVQMPLSDKGGHYRYDFYLPDHAVVCEYQGVNWHKHPDRVAADRIKEQFCIDNNVQYITYSGRDYYHMPHEIAQLMGRLGVRLKNIS